MSDELQRIQDWMPLARQAHWSVAKLAKLCGVSPRTLERYFRKNHNQTPEAWLMERRWRQALEILHHGASVKFAASELGYRHSNTFSREFKKQFGQCPSVFANKPVINL
jgi:AraC-like DNA-binding protein